MGAAIGRACNLDSAEDADKEAPLRNLSPCQKLSLQLFFLEALYNNLENKLYSLSEVDRKQWDELFQEIQQLDSSLPANDLEDSSLPANDLEVSCLPANDLEDSCLPANDLEDSSLPANDLEDSSPAKYLDVISTVIDDFFVTLVQNDDVLMSELGAYLPDNNVSPGQKWEHFLKMKLETMNACERRKFRQKYVGPREALGNVLRRCRRVVKMFMFAIERLDSKRVEVPESAGLHADANEEDGVNVFYATDRDQNDGNYIGQPGYATDRDQNAGNYTGQPCKRAHRLHYGRVIVSIPKGHKPGISETPCPAEDAAPHKHVIFGGEKQFWGDEERFVNEINASMQVITPPQTVILQTKLLFRTVALRNT